MSKRHLRKRLGAIGSKNGTGFRLMSLQKNKRMQSKKLREASRDQSCINCGVLDGSVVGAHLQGMRGSSFGRGIASKSHDWVLADLCGKCHSAFDNYGISAYDDKTFRSIDHSEQFLFCILKTIERRIEQGLISFE